MPFDGSVLVKLLMPSRMLSQTESNDVSAKTGGKEQAKEAFTDFISKTSAHGIGRIFDTKHGFIHRCLWAGFSLTAIVVLAVMVIKSYKDICSFPVKTLSNIKLKSPLDFPSITICNINSLDLTKFSESKARQLDHALSDEIFQGSFVGFNESDPIWKELADDVFDAAELGAGDFFKTCIYGDNAISHKNPLNCSAVFKEFRMGFERCFKLDQRLGPATIRTQLDLTIFVNRAGYMSTLDRVGVKFAIHSPGVIPDTSRSLHQASVGYATNVAIKMTEHHYLPEPYMAFRDKPCTDTNTEQFRGLMDGEPELYQMSRGNVYSLDACMTYKAYEKAAAKCNCTMKFIEAPYPLCTLGDMVCFGPAHSKLMQDAMTSGHLLGCYQPCNSVTYTQTISSAYYEPPVSYAEKYGVNVSELRKNLLKVSFFFEDLLVTEIRHVAEYDQNTIMGLFGGNMGFFLGASVLTLMEVAELAVYIVLCLLNHLWRCCFKPRPASPFSHAKVDVDKTGDVTLDDDRTVSDRGL